MVMSPRLLMAVVVGLLVALGHLIPLWTGVSLLVVGWALQLVGHFTFEKKSPAFMRNLTHLLVGPAWLATRVFQWRSPAGTDHRAERR